MVISGAKKINFYFYCYTHLVNQLPYSLCREAIIKCKRGFYLAHLFFSSIHSRSLHLLGAQKPIICTELTYKCTGSEPGEGMAEETDSNFD